MYDKKNNKMKPFPIPRDETWISGTFHLLLKLIGENYSTDHEFSNDVFTIRPYYWGDEEDEINRANFEIPSENFNISWYKYPFRKSYSSELITPERWYHLIQKCIESLK